MALEFVTFFNLRRMRNIQMNNIYDGCDANFGMSTLIDVLAYIRQILEVNVPDRNIFLAELTTPIHLLLQIIAKMTRSTFLLALPHF